MKIRPLLILTLGLILGLGLGATGLAWAQPSVTTTLRSPTPTRAGVGALSVTRVNDSTLVSVKDHGSSQTVIVYKIDERGTARLTHKAKFFY